VTFVRRDALTPLLRVDIFTLLGVGALLVLALILHLEQMGFLKALHLVVTREPKHYYGPFPDKIKACLSIYEVLKRTKESVDFWLNREIREIKDQEGFFENLEN